MKLGKQVVVALGLVLFMLPASADDDDYRYGRRSRQDSYGYGRGGGIRGGDPAVIASRVHSDLRRAASRGLRDGDDREDFREAQEELYKFQQRWRNGRFESGNLDRAIDNMKDLADSRHIHPRDRQLIYSGITTLRELRSNRGHYENYRYQGSGRRYPGF